jgi:hypothetical protein
VLEDELNLISSSPGSLRTTDALSGLREPTSDTGGELPGAAF